jgi:hypothetical protein
MVRAESRAKGTNAGRGSEHDGKKIQQGAVEMKIV